MLHGVPVVAKVIWKLPLKAGVDAFITGEASEQTTHIAHEYDVTFIGAGHHATERYGVQALGEYCQAQWDLDVSFIDLSNPV